MLLHSLLATALLTSLSGETKPPNIIFILTDDQRWDSFGCYGRPEFRTKAIDKLSDEGITFDNTHHAVAICRPSRATMVTGRYFVSHQSGFTYPHNETLPSEDFAQTYPAVLKKAGYRTGFIGKFGMRVENKTNLVKQHFDFFAGKSTTSQNGPNFPEDDATLNEIYRKDRDPKERTLIKGDAMLHFLDTQPKGQPFCLSVSFDAVKNDLDSQMYAPDKAAFENQNMTVPKNWVEGKNEQLPKLLDHWRGTSLHKHSSSSPKLYQNVARRFAAQGLSVDNQISRLMKKLAEMKLRENTIIIFTSDNGRFHGSHGLFGKAVLYEEAMKAPLIIWDGREVMKQKIGKRVSELVSSADIAPTILSLAGIEAPSSMQGEDISPLLDGSADLAKWKDAVFMENLFLQEMWQAHQKSPQEKDTINKDIIKNNRSYRSRGVRTKKYKYFIYYEHTPVIEELYDLTKDPYEQQNLVSNQEYTDVLLALRKRTEEFHEQYSR